MKRMTLPKVRSVLARAGTKLTHAQAQYKKDFDRAVRVLPSFEVGQEVFLDRPPDFTTTPLENEYGHRTLLPKTTGPYRVTKATPDTVTIDRNGILDTASINRVTCAPPPRTEAAPSATAPALRRTVPPSTAITAPWRTHPVASVDPDSQVPVDQDPAELKADRE